MIKKLEQIIENIVDEQVAALNRPDLFRKPIVSYSSADDSRYIDLKRLIGAWHAHPTELLPNAKSVISYFIPFTKEVIEQPKRVPYGSWLWSEAYQETNRHFNNVNKAISGYLIDEGYSTKMIPSTHNYDPKDLKCFWSHRSAAVIAGLGSFGINRLVITEKGSGGRFCSVITSATLTTNKQPVDTRCLYIKKGVCGLCLKTCPVQALAPNAINKFACQDRLNEHEAIIKASTNLQNADTCGKCISVCPFAYIP